MQRILILLICIVTLVSCGQHQGTIQKYLNPSQIPAQYFTINTDRDTLLRLKMGTKIFIPKDAIKSKTNTARLELKEAITAEQILAAGLFTQSNGKILSSAGMLYINFAKGEDASIVKPLKASVPTASLNPKMQLFKGEETEKGINWIDPQPIIIPKDTMLALGKRIFAANCASCHNPLKDATGPRLYRSIQHWGSSKEDKLMAYAFIRNPAKMIAAGHPYANCLYEKWNKTAMTAFPSLTEYELDAMYKYVDQEARERLGADTIKYFQYNPDTCRQRLARLAKLNTELYNLKNDQRLLLEIKKDKLPLPIPSSTIPDLPLPTPALDLVTPETPLGEYYNIEITTVGWVNLDYFVNPANNITESQLSVSLTGTYSSKMQILLIIPSDKVMALGGLLDDGKSFGFAEKNGKVILKQGVQGYILAMGEDPDKDQLYYGMSSFTTSTSQKIEVDVQPTDSTKMKAAMRSLNFEALEVMIKKDPNQPQRQSLQAQVSELEHLMEGCGCYLQESDADEAQFSKDRISVKK